MDFPQFNFDPGFQNNPGIYFDIKCKNIKSHEIYIFSFKDPEALVYFAKHCASKDLSIIETKIDFYEIYMIGIPDKNRRWEENNNFIRLITKDDVNKFFTS